MRRLFRFALLTVTGAALAQAPDLSKMDLVEQSVPDGPVALVDGSPVSGEDFLFLYRNQLAAMAAMQPGGLEDSVRVKTGLRCLAELIQREVLWQESRRRGLTVSDEAVNQSYDKKLKILQDRLAKRSGESAAEAQILEQAGQTREQALAELRKSFLVRKAWEAIGKEKGVAVTDEEIQQFYEERPQLFRRSGRIHLRQIYVRPQPSPSVADDTAWEAAQKRIDRALARVRAGESFEAVARDASDAPDRDKGGDMGVLPVSELPPFLLAVADKLEPGRMSGVFRSDLGFHIVKLMATEAEQEVSLDDARAKIEAVLMEAKVEEAVYGYCQPILDDPERVRFFLQLERTLAASSKPGETGETPSTAAAAP